MKRALIFDMDGVIVNNDRYHCLAWEEFAGRYGKTVGFDEIRSWFGSTNKTILERLFGTGMSMVQITSMGREKEEIYRRLYAGVIKPVPGLPEFLKELKGSFLTGVATSAPPENVEFVLRETGLKAFFNAVTDESDIQKGKPDPEIFLKAAMKLGVEPADCLVFEDSFQGIEAASRAGMHVVGVATTHESGSLENTDFVIHDFFGIDIKKLNDIFGA